MTWLPYLPFIVVWSVIAVGFSVARLLGHEHTAHLGDLRLVGKSPLTKKAAKLLSLGTGASVVLLSSFVFWMGGLEAAFTMALGVLGLAFVMLAPVFFLVASLADGTRAVKTAIEHRKVINTRTKDRRAGQLSTATPEENKGRLSNAASGGQMSLR